MHFLQSSSPWLQGAGRGGGQTTVGIGAFKREVCAKQVWVAAYRWGPRRGGRGIPSVHLHLTVAVLGDTAHIPTNTEEKNIS